MDILKVLESLWYRASGKFPLCRLGQVEGMVGVLPVRRHCRKV